MELGNNFLYGCISRWGDCGLVLLYMEGTLPLRFFVVGVRKPRHRDGLPPAPHAPGYNTPKLVEYFLTVCATLTLEGGPVFWVATHRIHHQHADKKGDPHSPLDGTWWAHMGWILTGKSLHHDTTTLAHYVPDLVKDKLPRVAPITTTSQSSCWRSRVGNGWTAILMWGIFVRTVLGLRMPTWW